MSSAPPEIPIAKKTYLSASSDDNSSDEEEAVLNAGKTVDIQSNGTANEKKQRLRSEVKFSLLTPFSWERVWLQIILICIIVIKTTKMKLHVMLAFINGMKTILV